MVVKRDGRRQPFDREKIIAGIVKACEKRPVSIDKIEGITEDIERTVQKKYDREVDAKDIGELIMEKLAALDEVAYVRFASVYRQFRDVNQFMSELKLMLDKEKYGKGQNVGQILDELISRHGAELGVEIHQQQIIRTKYR